MFKIYKGNDVVVEGESPLEITGVGPNKSVAAGEYQAVRVDGNRESDKVDIPAFKTLPIPVTGVSLDKTTLSLETGGTATLKATVSPSNATDKGVTWKSSDSAIATVDGNGKVTAVKAGTADITVTTKDAGKTAKCTVTVTEPEPPEEPEGGE